MLDQLEWQTDMVGKIAYIIDIEIHSNSALALCKSKFSSSCHQKIQKYHNWKYQNSNVVYFFYMNSSCHNLYAFIVNLIDVWIYWSLDYEV